MSSCKTLSNYETFDAVAESLPRTWMQKLNDLIIVLHTEWLACRFGLDAADYDNLDLND